MSGRRLKGDSIGNIDGNEKDGWGRPAKNGGKGTVLSGGENGQNAGVRGGEILARTAAVDSDLLGLALSI